MASFFCVSQGAGLDVNTQTRSAATPSVAVCGFVRNAEFERFKSSITLTQLAPIF